MKTFLATTATALVLGTSAYADAHTGAFSDITFDSAVNLNASEVIGMRVYASEADIQGETVTIDGTTEWDDIGEINEIVLTRDGSAQSVIIGVGGFLGMGEKDVAVSMDQLQFVTEEGEIENYFIVVNASTAGIQDAPAYEYTAMEDTMISEPAETDMAADTDMATPQADAVMAEPIISREGYSALVSDTVTAETLIGARVYGPDDEDVGEISELLMGVDGTPDRAIIDVGGFLGLGEKPVAVSMETLLVLLEDGGDDVRVYIQASQDALEDLPEYEG